MDIQEVKSLTENLGKAFEEFKSTQAENLKKQDSLVEEKLNRITDDMTKAMEEVQKKQAQLEAAAQRPAAADVKEVSEKGSRLFGEFLKKGAGSDRADFADFLSRKGIGAEEVKALSVNSDVDGGFLVPTAFGGVINTRIFESSPVRQYANVVTIGTADYEVVLDNDEASASWVAETGSRSATNTPTLDKRIIVTHEMYANPKATQKLLDDAILNAEQWLAGKVADKFARTEATAFISGSGNGQPFGITTNVTNSTSYDARNVQLLASGGSGTISHDGLVNVQNALKEGYQANAVWMMKRATFGTIMKIKSGITDDNTPIFNMMYDKNTGLPGFSLLTRPVVFADDVAAVAADAYSVIYGDFRAGYTIVDRAGIRVLRDPYSSKPYVEFYTTKRVGGDVVNAEAFKIMKLASSV